MSGKILIRVLVWFKEPENSDEAESLVTLGPEGTRGRHTQEKEGIVIARRKNLCSRVGVKIAKLLQGREEADEFSDLFFPPLSASYHCQPFGNFVQDRGNS